jgi:Fe-S-cluster containining protein
MSDKTWRVSLPVREPGGRVARVRFAVSGVPVDAEIPLPSQPTAASELLPVFRAITEVVVGVAVQQAEAAGQKVSCKAGCGACCRQVVPITEMEARLLRDLVEALPEPRRSTILARFADARRRLQEGGLLAKLDQPDQLGEEDLRAFGLEYFALGIPCPFLEDESCSIHPDRPLACREYLVTSPAENCSRPTAETVRMVQLAGKPSAAVSRLGMDAAPRRSPWVPLVLALDWAASHPDDTPRRPAQEILQEFFQRFART